MTIAAYQTHGRQHGIRDLFIALTLGAHLSNFRGVEFQEMLKALLIASKKDKKTQNKNDKRGDGRDINIVTGIGENGSQQAFRGSGGEQGVHRHQADGNDKDINDD